MPMRTTLRPLMLVCVTAVFAACHSPAAPTTGLASLSISGAPSQSVTVGKLIQLTVAAKDPRGGVLDNVNIVWSSDDPTIASVNDSGAVFGWRSGYTIIRATSGSIVGTTFVNVQPALILGNAM
jgi:hypothetical protein